MRSLLFCIILGCLVPNHIVATEDAEDNTAKQSDVDETENDSLSIGIDLGEDIGIGIAKEFRCTEGQPKGEDGLQYCKVLTETDATKRKALNESFLIFTPKQTTEAYERFLRSAKTFKYTVKELGTGKTETPESIFELFKKEIDAKSETNPNDIVLFIDNVDAILTAGAPRIIEELELAEATLLISSDSILRNSEIPAAKFPKLETDRQFMDSGSFVGTIKTLSKIFREFKSEKTLTDILEKAYLNKDTRKKLKIKIDPTCSVFQNLADSADEIDMRFAGKDAYLQNMVYGTVPIVVRANEKSTNLLNSLGSYLARSWNLEKGCLACWEDMISLEKEPDEKLPFVTLALFIEKPTPFLEEFFTTIEDLKYPKNRMHLYIHNAEKYHKKHVYEWLEKVEKEYSSLKNISFNEPSLKEHHAKNGAIDYCLEKTCDFLFMVDSVGRLNNPYTLRLLIEQNRNVIAPLLPKPGKAWSNYWGALSPQGFYARSNDYMEIVQNQRRGLWNVPYVTAAILIKRQILENSETRPTHIQNLEDPDVAFCQSLREKGIFMYVSNRVDFGHLVGTDTFDITRVNPDLWELFENRFDWERRYLHANWSQSLNESNPIENPCPDVFWFPVFKERYAHEMIEMAEAFGKWSDGGNMDQRIEGGYESVPTVDIHMKQLNFDTEYLEILRAYIQPLQLRAFQDYFNEEGPPRALMNFIVRYKPDEQPLLRPHHDTATYTINVGLNRPRIDYQGGGCRFIRYNCSVVDTRIGWILMHPGRLTHLHEGLRVTEGTRYILVSFIDP